MDWLSILQKRDELVSTEFSKAWLRLIITLIATCHICSQKSKKHIMKWYYTLIQEYLYSQKNDEFLHNLPFLLIQQRRFELRYLA